MKSSNLDSVAIWTPIRAETGFGHFYRMLGLYEQVRKARPAFYFTNKEFIPLENAQIECFHSDSNDAIADYLRSRSVRTLIIDNYEVSSASAEWFNQFFRVLYFDSKFENPRVAGIVNFNLFAAESFPVRHPGTRYFLGLDYMLFRRALLECPPTNFIKDRVFLSIGGSDVLMLTQKLVSVLPRRFSYAVVLGGGCSQDYVQSVRRVFAERNLEGEIYHQPANYFQVLAGCEFAIVSCSSVVYEVAFLGKRFLCFVVADNQLKLAAFLSGNGISVLRETEVESLREASIIDASCVKLDLDGQTIGQHVSELVSATLD